MGEKLLGLCVDKMAASPANKMAAPRTGLQGDKGAVGSDLSCLTAIVATSTGLPSLQKHQVEEDCKPHTQGTTQNITMQAGVATGR
ncbi:hypothetical protein EK904_014370 [Melospiza melodia maxima]|nr:hypothetical protein EK904_014370 [Melospiza melodia maxima]